MPNVSYVSTKNGVIGLVQLGLGGGGGGYFSDGVFVLVTDWLHGVYNIVHNNYTLINALWFLSCV